MMFNDSWHFSSFGFPFVFIPIAIWSAIWTGLALWYAAKRDEKGWFIFFMFVHTAGIMEILYLLLVVKAFVQPAKPARKKIGRRTNRR